MSGYLYKNGRKTAQTKLVKKKAESQNTETHILKIIEWIKILKIQVLRLYETREYVIGW